MARVTLAHDAGGRPRYAPPANVQTRRGVLPAPILVRQPAAHHQHLDLRFELGEPIERPPSDGMTVGWRFEAPSSATESSTRVRERP